MPKLVRGLLLTTGLSLMVLATPPVYADDKAEIQKAIQAIAADLEAGKDVANKAKEFKKKYEDLDEVMHAYKPKARGGIGVGPMGDGIEIKFNGLAKRALAPGALAKEKDDLIKAAWVNMAMAKITMEYAPAKPRGGKGAKEWNGLTKEMEKGTMELIDALKKGDSAAVKKAATNINSACNNCHSDFRD
jgi:hypothetical protein